jgi:hypothetical protein
MIGGDKTFVMVMVVLSRICIFEPTTQVNAILEKGEGIWPITMWILWETTETAERM